MKFGFLWSFLFPARCAICDEVLTVGKQEICNDCKKIISYVKEPTCKCCGKPLFDDRQEFCSDCMKWTKRHFHYGHAVFVYDKVMSDSVGRFKYHGRQEYAAFYAHAMYDQYGEWLMKLDNALLIPVPVHTHRYQKRGYNQAALVARELSKYTKLAVCEDILYRKKDTLAQKELNAGERLQNLISAFDCNDLKKLKQQSKCAILVDDIYTTGSTIEACSIALHQAGFDDIYFLCICIGKNN